MSLTYDDNGNIQTLNRLGRYNSSTSTLEQMDQLTYKYVANTNQLDHILDPITSVYTNDIKNQGTGNYQFDKIGQLTADAENQIQTIQWTAYHKVKAVIRTPGSTKSDMYYSYDAFGRRISKMEVLKGTGGSLTGASNVTHYVLDASGNQLAVYMETINTVGHLLPSTPVYNLEEQDIYGSARIGALQNNITLWTFGGAPAPSTSTFSVHTVGEKMYEITNHLGNVLTVITDRKLQDKFGVDTTGNNVIAYYTPDIKSVSDYYAFGMAMPGRSYNSATYRFGHNGQEKDAEIFDGAYTAEFWEYDSRSGRRWENDPMFDENISPYATFDNNPILYSDPSGLKPGWLARLFGGGGSRGGKSGNFGPQGRRVNTNTNPKVKSPTKPPTSPKPPTPPKDASPTEHHNYLMGITRAIGSVVRHIGDFFAGHRYHLNLIPMGDVDRTTFAIKRDITPLSLGKKSAERIIFDDYTSNNLQNLYVKINNDKAKIKEYFLADGNDYTGGAVKKIHSADLSYMPFGQKDSWIFSKNGGDHQNITRLALDDKSGIITDILDYNTNMHGNNRGFEVKTDRQGADPFGSGDDIKSIVGPNGDGAMYFFNIHIDAWRKYTNDINGHSYKEKFSNPNINNNRPGWHKWWYGH